MESGLWYNAVKIFIDVLLWRQSYANVFASMMSRVTQYQNKLFLEVD